MKKYKYVGKAKQASEYGGENIPKVGKVYDENEIFGILSNIPVSTWAWEFPNEWEEVSEDDGWFRVTEKLPSQYGDYLVYDEVFNCCGVAGYNDVTKKFSVYAESWEPEEISHWRPLPDPPSH